METNIYVIHDIKANTFGQLMFFPNNVEALRSLERIVKDPQTTLHQYPADYNLLEIGKYDSISGEISLAEKRTILSNCSSFIQ